MIRFAIYVIFSLFYSAFSIEANQVDGQMVSCGINDRLILKNMFEYGISFVCLRISVDKDWSLLARFIFFAQTCLLNGVSPLYRAQLIEPVIPQSENSGDNNTSSVNTRIGPSNLCRVS